MEPFGTRDTAAEFGTVPKNSGRLATLFTEDLLYVECEGKLNSRTDLV